LNDLSTSPLSDVFNFSDPDSALDAWYSAFLPVLDMHAPVKRRRVKHPKLPPWLNADITNAMAQRDQFKKSKQFVEYKKARNKVKNMVRDSKRALFQKLV
jgi:hypothetical protein